MDVRIILEEHIWVIVEINYLASTSTNKPFIKLRLNIILKHQITNLQLVAVQHHFRNFLLQLCLQLKLIMMHFRLNILLWLSFKCEMLQGCCHRKENNFIFHLFWSWIETCVWGEEEAVWGHLYLGKKTAAVIQNSNKTCSLQLPTGASPALINERVEIDF